MTQEPRPNRYPPPEFPPRRAALFARTPPAIFPSILGLLGLALALRAALRALGQPAEPADLVGGAAVALWAFAVLAYLVKVIRRPGVVVDDLRVLPGRSGLAALSLGGMAAAAVLAPFEPVAAKTLLVGALTVHLLLATLLVRLLLSLPPVGREVNPTWHLSFVGYIVAAPAAVALGWTGLAALLFWGMLPLALAIWGLSLMQLLRAQPPEPLRPLMAIHVAPAALLALVGALIEQEDLATLFMVIATLLALLLGLSGRWLIAAGITPLWGAFTFPLAALATAMLANGWREAGLILTLVALVANPLILAWVLKRWPGGRLATVTNAAEA